MLVGAAELSTNSRCSSAVSPCSPSPSPDTPPTLKEECLPLLPCVKRTSLCRRPLAGLFGSRRVSPRDRRSWTRVLREGRRRRAHPLFTFPRLCPASSSRTLVHQDMARPSLTSPRRRPPLSLTVAAALLTSSMLLLLSPPLEAEAAPVGSPEPVGAVDDSLPAPAPTTVVSVMSDTPTGRWRTPIDGAATAPAAPVFRPRARQPARSVVEDPPLVVDRGEYGGGWGAPQSQVAMRQEVVVVDVGAPPRS